MLAPLLLLLLNGRLLSPRGICGQARKCSLSLSFLRSSAKKEYKLSFCLHICLAFVPSIRISLVCLSGLVVCPPFSPLCHFQSLLVGRSIAAAAVSMGSLSSSLPPAGQFQIAKLQARPHFLDLEWPFSCFGFGTPKGIYSRGREREKRRDSSGSDERATKDRSRTYVEGT